jgi:protein MpaA
MSAIDRALRWSTRHVLSGFVAVVAAVAALAAAGCSAAEGSGDAGRAAAAGSSLSTRPSTVAEATVAEATTAPSATVEAATTSSTTSSTTTTTTTTVPTTTTVADTAALAVDAIQRVEIGRSVEGRPIMAVQRGTPGGTVVLVIGVIHGDEDAGVEIVRRLATAAVPPGIELWLVESINPDGQAAGIRTNANLVDLNRNFPRRWAPLGQPGDWQYAGTGAASEPETQAIVGLIEQIRPDLGIWYHQDLFRIAPTSGRAGEVRARYAELTGLPLLGISGGTYTGTAAAWQREAVSEGIAFIVELGPELTSVEADTHATAVLTIASD